ncbi:Toll/interleukin-1 receptor domain-containing protein, partial [Tanacetum coccineum]
YPATKCLKSWSTDLRDEVAIKGLAKMKGLRFLDVYIKMEDYYKNDIVQLWEFDKDREYLPSSLRFMRWSGFPFSSLPNTFHGKHLVGLELYRSNIVQIWKNGEEKVLNNLRFLTIENSKLRTFDLMLAPNLEQLTILNCYHFVELHIPADHHSKIEYLHIYIDHSKLKTIHLGNTPNLKTLQLTANILLKTIHLRNTLNLKTLQLTANRLSKTVHLGSTPNLEKIILKGL